ncbi:uncharacterized protein LOC120681107 [Panicum virgatum]|nr:uncharacterized protein LOC120681107 [Panicum virgatum]
MTTEEMMEEEMFAAILAKLEELGKKMDDTNRKADGVNQKIDKMNVELCSRAEAPKPSAVPPIPSPTSSPLRDAALVVSVATTELLPEAPTRCSMADPSQATCSAAATSLASAMASPTSSPPWDTAHVVPGMATKLLEMAPTRCSMTGLYSLPECACSGVCVHVRRTAHAFITSARPSSVGVHCNGTTLHFLSSVNGYVNHYTCSKAYEHSRHQPNARYSRLPV